LLDSSRNRSSISDVKPALSRRSAIMTREELISSAVTFLQDPSVSSSPLEKRVAFLRSKNLTQEEIDLALARAVENVSSSVSTATPSQEPLQPTFRPSNTSPQGYGYNPYAPWRPSPPEVPRRDWRDWFIMATVTGGLGYGLYFLVKRYVAPLISPPTPAQLQQDKESIDEQFSHAFALIEQLSNDTAALKSAEEARTERLDAALHEVEGVVSELKSAFRRRDDDARRISDEVKNLKESIPRAIEGAREGNENRLKELGTELRSLKVLMGNRLSANNASTSSLPGRMVGGTTTPGTPRLMDEAPSSSSTNDGAPTTSQTSTPNASPSITAQTNISQTPNNDNSSTHFGKPASIPTWQLAAASRSKTVS